jgi:arsenical pump membrane protein
VAEVAAFSILAFTVGLSLRRPRVGRLTIDHAAAALLGMLLCIATGLVSQRRLLWSLGLTIAASELPALPERMLALSALIGADLGPKMLPVGSLAALMWFRILRQRGVEVSYRLYVRIGVPVSLAAVLLALLTLYAELRCVQAWG